MQGPVCPVCGSNELSPFVTAKGVRDKNVYRIFLCSSCHLGVSDYAVDYPFELNFPERITKGLRMLEDIYIYFRWYQELRWLKKYIPSGSYILDIGCGDGIFIKICNRHGYFAEGVEKTKGSRTIAFGETKIYELDVEEDGLPDKLYDCITMFHALEHLKRPVDVLIKIKDILKKDGKIVVQVPNLDSWQFKFFRGKWFHLFMPFHRYHFTTEALMKILRKAGYEILSIRYFSNRWNPEGWSASFTGLYPLGFRRWRDEIIYGLFTILFLPIAFLEGMFKKGGVITVVARRIG